MACATAIGRGRRAVPDGIAPAPLAGGTARARR